MCCPITVLFLLGPRAAVLVWWLVDPARWDIAFSTWVWPVLGFFLAPWTTLCYVLVAPGGVHSLDWIWIAIGVAADISFWTGGAYGNRDRMHGHA
ncbi:MAG: hypothetical protein R2826_10230 [Thermoleophilia bacterium]